MAEEKSSLKGKALSLEKLLFELQNTMETHRKRVASMQNEHNGGSTFNAIECKAKKIRTTLEMELEKIQSELKSYITNRKASNLRLMEEVATIKNEKSYLQRYLVLLGGRVQEIQQKLGTS